MERNFYKLLNNSNFGIDCGSNIDNRILELIYDEISEIAYIKTSDNIFLTTRNTFHFQRQT